MSGWVIGWAIGAVVVVIVVVLLLLMIRGASRATAKTDDIIEALERARHNTAALWRVADTNRTAGRIVEAASATREALAGEKGRP